MDGSVPESVDGTILRTRTRLFWLSRSGYASRSARTRRVLRQHRRHGRRVAGRDPGVLLMPIDPETGEFQYDRQPMAGPGNIGPLGGLLQVMNAVKGQN